MTDSELRRAQEASPRSMSELFGQMETPIGRVVGADLKSVADRLKWAGERLEDINAEGREP